MLLLKIAAVTALSGLGGGILLLYAFSWIIRLADDAGRQQEELERTH